MRGIHRWLSPLALAAVFAALAGLAAPSVHAATVVGLALPTRGDSSALRERTRDTARRVAERMAASLKELPAEVPSGLPVSTLEQRIDRAQQAYLNGALDEAASVFDAALEDGARRIDLIAAGAPALATKFLTAHVTRASIALARGELERGEQLLERALRLDPRLTLDGGERTPKMRALFADVSKRLGPRPALAARDLGEACTTIADILLIARFIDGGAVEFSRFDGCRPIVSVQTSSDDPAVAERLAHVAAPPSSSAPQMPTQPSATTTGVPAPSGPTPTTTASASPRRKLWPYITLTALGLALAGTGAGLVGSVSGEYDRLSQTCASGDCAPSVYAAYERREIAGWSVLGIGAAATAVGATLLIVMSRPPRATPEATSR